MLCLTSAHIRSVSSTIGAKWLFGMTHRTSISLLALVATLSAQAQTALPIPDTLTGPDFTLEVRDGTWQFHADEVVDTYGVNGDLLAPTLILNRGEQVTLNVTNTLPDLTTMHWHGLHIPAADDGGPHSLIYPNTTWSPSFTVLDRASTFWYHPHSHGLTDFQVSMGLAGMIIVRDDLEAALALPRTYGVDDIPLIIQTKAIVDGQIAMHTGLDSVVVVNGVRNALASLPAQIVRLRCLNGASERTFKLGFSNGMSFHVIGTDGGLLSEPVLLSRLQLMPGERVELLVDLNDREGEAFQLMAYNSELPNGIIGSAQVGNGMATLDGYDENALNGADFPLLNIATVAQTAGPITAVPASLVPVDRYDDADVNGTREFTFQPQATGPMQAIEGPFEINDALFNMNVINETVELGATEIWTFVNNTMVGHPIHVHDIQFNIRERNGLPPEAWEMGWKDVVYVPPMGSASVITRFDDFADPDMPYMYHCHLLMHEDEGMMGQFLVVDPTAIAEVDERVGAMAVSPNPSRGEHIRLYVPTLNGRVRLTVFDAAGRSVVTISTVFAQGTHQLDATALAPGAYTILVVPYNDQRPFSARLVLQP